MLSCNNCGLSITGTRCDYCGETATEVTAPLAYSFALPQHEEFVVMTLPYYGTPAQRRSGIKVGRGRFQRG